MSKINGKTYLIVILCFFLLALVPSCSPIILDTPAEVEPTSIADNSQSDVFSSDPSNSKSDLSQVSLVDGSNFVVEWEPDQDAINYHFQL